MSSALRSPLRDERKPLSTFPQTSHSESTLVPGIRKNIGHDDDDDGIYSERQKNWPQIYALANTIHIYMKSRLYFQRV